MEEISPGRAGGFTVAGPSKGPFRNRPWCNRVPLHRRERCAPKRRRTYSRKCQTLTATPAEPGVLPGAIESPAVVLERSGGEEARALIQSPAKALFAASPDADFHGGQ